MAEDIKTRDECEGSIAALERNLEHASSELEEGQGRLDAIKRYMNWVQGNVSNAYDDLETLADSLEFNTDDELKTPADTAKRIREIMKKLEV